MLLLPVVSATFINELSQLQHWWSKDQRTVAITCIMFMLLTVWQSPALLRRAFFPLANADSARIEQIRIAHSLNHNILPADGSIGLHYLGISFHVPTFHVVDFLGKAEPYIARSQVRYGPIGHNRWDYGYALSNYKIAAIPIMANVVRRVQSLDYKLEEHDYMFWEIAATTILLSENYTFLGPEFFENETFGAFIRKDLVANFMLSN